MLLIENSSISCNFEHPKQMHVFDAMLPGKKGTNPISKLSHISLNQRIKIIIYLQILPPTVVSMIS